VNILAIETSCDESSIALITATQTGVGVSFSVHENLTHSQIDLHRQFGGVFPAMAKRDHQKNLVPLLLQVLQKSSVSPKKISSVPLDEILSREPILFEAIQEHITALPVPAIDAICVTSGPGLEPALWVGINFAKALGALWGVPVIPVNHMEGHILSVLAPSTTTPQSLAEPRASSPYQGEQSNLTFSITHDTVKFPALALLISGGHTELVLVKNMGEYEIIGKTRDDAVGEAFDKVARMLGLPYPGGPQVSTLASEYSLRRPSAERLPLQEGDSPVPHLPRPMIKSNDFDFSFSGLKTAVLYYIKNLGRDLDDTDKQAVSFAFQEAVTEVLVTKTRKAVETYGAQTLIVGGGVSANQRIITGLQTMIDEHFSAVTLLAPTRELTGDNALMIALAGYFKLQKNPDAVYDDIRAEGNLSF
jgi:N6-L-threonylcarbamoyladenine synthase